MKTEGTNLLLLTMSAFWSSAEKYPIRWSLETGFTVFGELVSQIIPQYVGKLVMQSLR